MIGLLVKNRLMSLFGSVLARGRGGRTKNVPLWKKVLVPLLMVALVAYFVIMVSNLLKEVAALIIPAGGDWFYYALVTLVSFTMSFIFSIFETKAELFDCRDNDLLLSMPIKSSQILASRILVVLIYNYAIDAVLMIPAIVIYGIYSNSIWGILGGVLVYLFAPLLAVSFASAFGFVIAVISKRIKHKTAVAMVLVIAFLCAYFWGYSVLVDGILGFIINIEEAKGQYPLLVFVGSIALLDFVQILSFIILTVIVAMIAFSIISFNYAKVIASTQNGTRVKYEAKKLASSGVVFSIIKKEYMRFTSSATYMLNAGLGFVMPIILSVYALVNAEFLNELFSLAGEFVSPFVPLVIPILLSTGYMSACSLSLEGNAFWIIKSMPIPARTVVLAKALPQLLISVPVSIVSGVCICIATAVEPVYWVFTILIGIFSAVGFAFFGISVNIFAPRFDYPNETHVVKRSLSATVTLLLGMALAAAIIALAYLMMQKGVQPLVAISIELVYYTVFAAAAAFIALVPCSAKLDKMNV